MTFQHRAGVSPYTSPFGFAETCVFAKQSLGPFFCGPIPIGRPFSLSYGAILPSSLTTLLPSAFKFSSRLPVSVCGTGSYTAIAAFLGGVALGASLLCFRSPSRFTLLFRRLPSGTRLCAWPGLAFPRSPLPSALLHFLNIRSTGF